jgi:hypothetical protein
VESAEEPPEWEPEFRAELEAEKVEDAEKGLSPDITPLECCVLEA